MSSKHCDVREVPLQCITHGVLVLILYEVSEVSTKCEVTHGRQFNHSALRNTRLYHQLARSNVRMHQSLPALPRMIHMGCLRLCPLSCSRRLPFTFQLASNATGVALIYCPPQTPTLTTALNAATFHCYPFLFYRSRHPSCVHHTPSCTCTKPACAASFCTTA